MRGLELSNASFPVELTDCLHPISFPLVNQQGYVLGCQLLFRVKVKQGGAIFTVSLMVGEPVGRMVAANVYGHQIFPQLKAWEALQLGENPKLLLDGMPETTYLEKVLALVKQAWGITPRINRLPLAGLRGADDAE